MTWTIKPRPHVAGSPMVADYECPVHGRFEATVQRDENGDPPAMLSRHPIDFIIEGDQAGVCRELCPWRTSAPKLARDSVPCYAAMRGGDTERRPGMLDTRPLADGMPVREWKAKQRAAQQERRHHQ